MNDEVIYSCIPVYAMALKYKCAILLKRINFWSVGMLPCKPNVEPGVATGDAMKNHRLYHKKTLPKLKGIHINVRTR